MLASRTQRLEGKKDMSAARETFEPKIDSLPYIPKPGVPWHAFSVIAWIALAILVVAGVVRIYMHKWFTESLGVPEVFWTDFYMGVKLFVIFGSQETLCSPPPVSRPHPPILIGGLGEKKTLRLVAQYGDACNLFDFIGLDVLKHKIDVLKRHCDQVGRDYGEIEKTTLGRAHLDAGQMSPKDVIEHCRVLADLGVQHAIFNMPNPHEIVPLETFGKEIIPEVAGF